MKRVSLTKAYLSLGLLLMVIIIGVAGYMILEGYTFNQAFFMTIITIATVGFGMVKPLSTIGMYFTAFLIILSFGIFAYTVSTLTAYIADGVFRNYYRTSKVLRKIDKIKDHVIICGFGRNGRQAVTELMSHDVPIVVVEKDESTLEKIIQIPELLYVNGDATQDEILDMCKINKARALITTLPTDADNLYVVLTARQMNPELTIISRASDDSSHKKLKQAGATSVIMPDRIGGQRMAKLVAQPDIVEFLDYILLQTDENVNISEIHCYKLCEKFDEKPIRTLEKHNESGATIIGLKREDKSFVINPLPEIILTPQDKIFALGTKRQIKRLQEIIDGVN